VSEDASGMTRFSDRPAVGFVALLSYLFRLLLVAAEEEAGGGGVGDEGWLFIQLADADDFGFEQAVTLCGALLCGFGRVALLGVDEGGVGEDVGFVLHTLVVSL